MKAIGRTVEIAASGRSSVEADRGRADDGDLGRSPGERCPPHDAGVGWGETARLAALGSLLAAVSHELRGPTSALAMLVPQLRAMVADAGGGPAGLGVVRDVALCVDRVLGLCDQLRVVTRATGEPEEMDLASLVEEIVTVARIHARHHGVRIELETDPVVWLGRREALGQVVLNLLLNAIDACRDADRADRQGLRSGAVEPGAHRVDVALRASGGDVVLEVSDTGLGVPEQLREVIFLQFFTTKPRGEGTGLGLAISRSIVEAHGGRIEVGVGARGGARFCVTLPGSPSTRTSHTRLRQTRRPVERVLPSIRPPRVGPPRHVLLLDDDALLGRTICRALAPHTVTVATTVAEARAHIEAGEPFDLVLADIGLPDGGGIAFHRWIEKHPAQRVPVVFATGGAVTAEEESYLARSGCTVLLKPTPLTLLLEQVERAGGVSSPLPVP